MEGTMPGLGNANTFFGWGGARTIAERSRASRKSPSRPDGAADAGRPTPKMAWGTGSIGRAP